MSICFLDQWVRVIDFRGSIFRSMSLTPLAPTGCRIRYLLKNNQYQVTCLSPYLLDPWYRITMKVITSIKRSVFMV